MSWFGDKEQADHDHPPVRNSKWQIWDHDPETKKWHGRHEPEGSPGRTFPALLQHLGGDVHRVQPKDEQRRRVRCAWPFDPADCAGCVRLWNPGDLLDAEGGE